MNRTWSRRWRWRHLYESGLCWWWTIRRTPLRYDGTMCFICWCIVTTLVWPIAIWPCPPVDLPGPYRLRAIRAPIHESLSRRTQRCSQPALHRCMHWPANHCLCLRNHGRYRLDQRAIPTRFATCGCCFRSLRAVSCNLQRRLRLTLMVNGPIVLRQSHFLLSSFLFYPFSPRCRSDLVVIVPCWVCSDRGLKQLDQVACESLSAVFWTRIGSWF